MHLPITRREAIATVGVAFGTGLVRGAEARTPSSGRVEGWPEAASAGQAVLDAGGNAVDAIVTAALVASVVAPQNCGPGGYGGHCIVGLNNGDVAAIDFNSAAPAAFREDIFPLDNDGNVVGRVNETGWLAAGVPGTLAGLQRALDRFGTWNFARCAELAIRYAREGFTLSSSLAGVIKGNAVRIRKDPATAALLLTDGMVPKAGDVWRNPDLATMLETLAKHGSVEAFYRGEIAKTIAAAFEANGGLVTEADLAAYQARDVEPLKLDWNGFGIFTPPPTSGGLTSLEALAVLKQLNWRSVDSFDDRRTLIEALRVAWRDRLKFLGDLEQADVPTRRLLSDEHIASLANEVSQAIKTGKPVASESDGRPAGGTVHLSAADKHGNFAALTLTHGGSFGATVTVPGLGLILGHGMSRFEPKPGHPNSPGPGKRPLHNMCPTIVQREGKPIAALGGRGGRKIVNSVCEVLARVASSGASFADAIAAPRLHTEGDLALVVENTWPADDAAQLAAIGYSVRKGPHATVSAVWTNDRGSLEATSR